VTEQHFVDLLRVEPGAFQGRLDGDGSEVDGGQRAESPTEASDGGAGNGSDY
jgi:hypothetical protein